MRGLQVQSKEDPGPAKKRKSASLGCAAEHLGRWFLVIEQSSKGGDPPPPERGRLVGGRKVVLQVGLDLVPGREI